MATAVSEIGAYNLFYGGWTSSVAQAKLYTNLDVLVDTQAITLNYASSQMQVSADIVFSVAAGTNDVSYVEIGYTSPAYEQIPESWMDFYSKDLALLYDFATAGTLTIDSFNISVTGDYLQAAGRDELCQYGFDSKVTWAKLYTSADALLDTQSVTLETSIAGVCSPTADIVFTVTSGTGYYVALGYGTTVMYKRLLGAGYTFTTPGTLTVSSWEMTI